MRPKKLTKEQNDILVRIEMAEVEVNYFLAIRETSDTDEYLAHRQTALLALEVEQKEINDFSKGRLLNTNNKAIKTEDCYWVEIDEEKLQGKSISLQQFFGWHYSVERHQAAIRGRSSDHLNDYFWAGAEENLNNVLKNKSIYNVEQGYAYAFFEPPYGMQGTATEKENLFHCVEKLFFDQYDVNANIWSWSAECSNYFDAGNEWWGTYFYTYSLPDSDSILGIIASTSD